MHIILNIPPIQSKTTNNVSKFKRF